MDRNKFHNRTIDELDEYIESPEDEKKVHRKTVENNFARSVRVKKVYKCLM